MLKKVNLLLFVSLLIVISGCAQSGTSGGGTPGSLNIKFLENNPPEQLREEQSFRVALELNNGILQDISYIICVSDSPASRFGGIQGEECANDKLTAATETGSGIINTVSEPIIFPLEGGAYAYQNLEFGVDTSSIIAELSYDLQTTHSGEVCLRKDFDVEVPNNINCDFQQSISNIEYAGGPIKVSSLKLDLSPQQDNKLGVFLDLGFSSSSNERISYFEEGDNSFGLEVSIGDVKLTCPTIQDGAVKLTETNKKVNCRAIIDMGNNDYFTDTVLVKTSYTSTTTKTITIPLKEEVEI